MDRRSRTVLVSVVTVISAVLLIASIPLKIAIVSDTAAVTGSIVTPATFLLFSVIGTVVVVRRSGHPIGWLFSVAGLGWAVMWFSGVVVERAHALGDVPFEPISWISGWTEIVGIATVAVALYLFPTGRPPSPRWRWWIVVTTVIACVAIAAEAFAPGPLEDHPYFDNPYGAGSGFTFLRNVAWPSLLIPLLLAPASLVIRFRRAHAEERQQLKWMLLGGVFVAAYVFFWAFSVALFGNDQVAESFQGVALSTIPGAAGVAILKYRLYDIDVVINRALVYGTLSAILAMLYAGIVFGLQAILSPVTEQSDVAIAASTLAVAALVRPLRTRVQAFIDRRFYRRRFDVQRTLDDFSSELRNEVDLPALSARLTEVVATTMQPAHVSLWLRTETPL